MEFFKLGTSELESSYIKTHPIAVVLGGSKSGSSGIAGKAFKLQYADGSIEWKRRDAITRQTDIKANDPAIAAKQWQELRY